MSKPGVHEDTAEGSLPLLLLGAAGFLSAIGARIVDPLLAALASEFNTTISVVSLLITAFTFAYGCNQLILGPVGDRFGKLRLLVGALAFYSLFMFACALAADLPILMVFRAFAGAASAGLIPTCLAYIGDAVRYEERQVVLSRFLIGVVLAQVMAGPLGGMFGEFLGWRGVFVLLGAGGLLVGLVLLVRIRRLPDRQHTSATFRRATYAVLLRHRPARLLLLVTIAEGILLPGSFPFIAPYLVDHFGLSYFGVGLILSCLGLGAMIYTRYAAFLLQKLGESGLVLCGGLLVAVTMGVALLANRWEMFILVEVALGLGYFMLHSVMQARATELLPAARATAVSLFIFMLFIGQGLGAVLMGTAIAFWGYGTAFQLNVAATLVLTVWLANYMRRTAAVQAAC
jgi:predicted MFS family arabinose efflux permease